MLSNVGFLLVQTMHPTFDIVFIAFQRLHQLRQVCSLNGYC